MSSSAVQLDLIPAEEPLPQRPRPASRAFPPRHPCVACGTRPARFQYRGEVKADRHHTHCFQFFRAAANRARPAPVAALCPSLGKSELARPPVPRPESESRAAGAACPHQPRAASHAPRLRGAAEAYLSDRAAAFARRRRRAQMAARAALDAGSRR